MSDPIYHRIRAAAARGALTHALLVTGPGDRLAAARYAAAAMECTSPGAEKPCGVCSACRKVREDIHPDVITVRDPEHKNVSVEVVREARKDAYIRPNEGERKVYLFPDCALLTETDQNVLLKLVEEGPPYAAFLFCAENPAAVLQTLRSRCVELKLQPAEGEEAAPEAWEELCMAILDHQPGEIALLAARLENQKLSREDVGALLARCWEAFAQALLEQYGKPPARQYLPEQIRKRLTARQMMALTELLDNYRRECGYNVNPGQLLGGLAAELEGFF